ncbi:hypothetical protein DXG01_011634, partial [Tephrocybe rancida]
MPGKLIYGKEEKEVIKAHKRVFEKARDTAGCDSVVRDMILPDLLAFYNWTKHPRATAVEGNMSIVTELKELTSNNWRKTATAKDTKDLKVNVAEIVDHLFRDRVNETLRGLVGVEELGQDPQQEFQLWNCAIKTVRENLSTKEMMNVNAEKVRVATSGNPPEKQRVTADKHGQSRIEAEDRKRFMEMGMFSLSLVAWVDSTGQFKVQAHDTMVFLKGSRKETFRERNKDFVQEMLRKFLEYIFYLHDMACVAPSVGEASIATNTGITAPVPDPPQLSLLGTDSQGYPRLPEIFPSRNKELVKLCREYMNAQY